MKQLETRRHFLGRNGEVLGLAVLASLLGAAIAANAAPPEAQNTGVLGDLPKLSIETDGPIRELVTDLKQRGMLDDTLVVWGGEFGRTIYSQGGLSQDNYGRDHHAKYFTVWLAGGGAQGGVSHGTTDEFSYSITSDPVHVRYLNAMILRCLGIDHKKISHRIQGLDQRLTDVEVAHVVQNILA